MPKARRCTYTEGGRRCTFNGTGDPSLCDPHRVAVAAVARARPPGEVLTEAIVDLLSGRPINRQQTLGALQDLTANWSGTIGGTYRPDVDPGQSEGSVHRRAQPGTQLPWWWNIPHAMPRRGGPAPAPPEDPERQKRRAARQVFGFKESDLVAEDVIRDRHRKLVKKHHPDRGGKTETMAIINEARDILINEAREKRRHG